MAIMPTRSFPPGAISEAGDVCPNATPDKPASNAIDRRSRPMCVSGEQVRFFKVEGKTLTITTAMDDQRTERERNQTPSVGNQTNRRALCGLAGGILFTLTPNVFPGVRTCGLP
jgi:hypothetical protein